MSEQPYLSPYDPGAGPYPPGHFGKASGPRAGFGRRLAAALVDGLVVGVPTWIVIFIVFGFDISTRHADGTTSVSYNVAFGQTAVASIVILLYRALLDGGPNGQTLGKKALSIRVVDAATGQSIGYGRGFGRGAGKMLFDFLMYACLLGLVDYLWMLWDRENQTLHDKMVNSYVVPVEAYPIQ